ncbi:MAG: FAD-binding oxidoreductase [Alphaproteobacteria bacterium]
MTLPAGLIEAITSLVGERGVVTDPADMPPYLTEERGLYRGVSSLVVRPASTAEAAGVVALCAVAGVPIVPQGGNTGLVGGGVPRETGEEIVLATRRLNRIRDLDPVNHTMTVEAGCILADIRRVADEAGCLFPLSLAAEGTCQIGGNIASNAGGLEVLRYGTMRDLVLGLEVVLPDGRVWDGLRGLAKDNTGYALKHLFIGAEGTLGLVTAAVLKLFPKPRDVQTALCGIERVEDVLGLLSRARSLSGDAVSAFELIPRIGLDFVTRHIPGTSDPMESPHPWYVLLELSTSSPAARLREAFEALLSEAFEAGEIADAVIAESLDQTAGLWRLRETLPESQKHEGGSIKHDVAVPVSRVPQFLHRATTAVEAAMPGVRVCAFGHVGDGNIHFNLSQPEGVDKAAFLARWEPMNRLVHDIVADLGGSFSAEHGIGRLKLGEMARHKSAVELDLMRRVKQALDPAGLMNPGKVIPQVNAVSGDEAV